jgi:sigma-B regulation protein RsbU (phosphoserine phosphatase)
VWHAANIEVPAFERTSRERTFNKGIGLPGRVWANERPAWIPDVMSEDNFPRAPVAATDGLHGAFAFPIRSGVEFLGVVEFFSRSIQEPDEKLQEMMTMIGVQISQFIERRTAERMVREREREFELARQIQLGLLPRAVPVVPGYAFGGAARFRQETGGDYYDFFPLGEPGVGIAVGDASGHGIAAALIIAATSTALRTLAQTHRDPGEILAVVNQLLIEQLVTDHFVTFFLARIDPRNHSLAYSSAGHCTGHILQRDGKYCLALPSTGMPLGIEPGAKFPPVPDVTLQPDELVLVVTDGVLEARSPDEVPFGVERALHVVATHFEETPTKICQALLAAVQDFCPPEGPFDDATAAIIKRAPAG